MSCHYFKEIEYFSIRYYGKVHDKDNLLSKHLNLLLMETERVPSL